MKKATSKTTISEPCLVAQQALSVKAAQKARASSTSTLERFTTRQLQVMEMLVLGASNVEIADSIGISENTVKVHIWRLFRQIGVGSRAKAVQLWREETRRDEEAKIATLQESNELMLSALIWLKSNPESTSETHQAIVANTLAKVDGAGLGPSRSASTKRVEVGHRRLARPTTSSTFP